MTYGEVLNHLQESRLHAAYRAGWNGKGMWVALQSPDANSKMSKPYTYLQAADGDLVPWVPSQTDHLADDWVLMEAA